MVSTLLRFIQNSGPEAVRDVIHANNAKVIIQYALELCKYV